MKILLLLLLFPVLAQSNCKVYIPEKVFLHAGLEINFDFSKILKDKQYVEVFNSDQNHFFEIHINGQEPERGHFHFADTQVNFLTSNVYLVKAGASVRCPTQYCSVGDFSKSFNRAMRVLAKNLVPCQELSRQ